MVSSYKNEYVPDFVTHPGETLLDRISHMDHKFCRTECRFLGIILRPFLSFTEPEYFGAGLLLPGAG